MRYRPLGSTARLVTASRWATMEWISFPSVNRKRSAVKQLRPHPQTHNASTNISGFGELKVRIVGKNQKVEEIKLGNQTTAR